VRFHDDQRVLLQYRRDIDVEADVPRVGAEICGERLEKLGEEDSIDEI